MSKEKKCSGTCPSCGGLKAHHTDHAPNGFESCSVCNGTGKVAHAMTKGEMIKLLNDDAIRYKIRGIIKSVKKGFYAHSFQGGQVEDTGKFTFSVNLGYMIEDGNDGKLLIRARDVGETLQYFEGQVGRRKEAEALVAQAAEASAGG